MGWGPQYKPAREQSLPCSLSDQNYLPRGAHMPSIQSNLLPRPQRKAAVIYPALVDPALAGRGGWVTEALLTCPFFPSPPWLHSIAGIWKPFLFTQCHQDAAARGNLGFPTGSFQRLHAKQPAVLQGASGPCYISLEENVTICANRSSWFVCLSSVWGTSLLLGGSSFVVVIVVLYSSACQFSSFFLFLLLYVHLPGLTARMQGGQLRGW